MPSPLIQMTIPAILFSHLFTLLYTATVMTVTRKITA